MSSTMSPKTGSAAAELVSRLRGLAGHVFWPDAVSLLDPEVCDVDHLTTSGQVTDSYLLALAVANSGSLATFDKRLVTSAKSVEPKARCAYWAAPDRRGCRVRDAHSGSGGYICEAPLWAHRIGGARPCLDRRMRRHESRPARSPASVCFQRPMVRPHADPAGRTGSGAT